MHLEVLVGAVAEELRTIGSEIGESGDVLLRCEPGYLVEVDRVSPFCVEHYLSDGLSVAISTISFTAAGSTTATLYLERLLCR
jgi:hypothetical protein